MASPAKPWMDTLSRKDIFPHRIRKPSFIRKEQAKFKEYEKKNVRMAYELYGLSGE